MSMPGFDAFQITDTSFVATFPARSLTVRRRPYVPAVVPEIVGEKVRMFEILMPLGVPVVCSQRTAVGSSVFTRLPFRSVTTVSKAVATGNLNNADDVMTGATISAKTVALSVWALPSPAFVRPASARARTAMVPFPVMPETVAK